MSSDLPYDLFLQVCKFCSVWKDVVSLRGVCRSWNYFFKSRDVWVHLVSSFLDRPSSPRFHYLERPTSSYSAADLERVYKRWRVAEKTWKATGKHKIDRRLDLDPGCLAKASILAPGGRWLIVFTNLVRAFCFDLDSTSPSPIAIIPAQIQPNSQLLPEKTEELESQIYVQVSEPEASLTAETLSFRAVVTFRPPYLNSIVQVWQFDAALDNATGQSSLTARRAFSWSLAHGGGPIRCRSLLRNIVVLETPFMDVGPDIPPNISKFCIFNWRKAKENPNDFPFRMLFTPNPVKHLQLLNDGYLLLSSYGAGLELYDYTSVPFYTGPCDWQDVVDLHQDIQNTLSHNFYTHISKPYYAESSSEESEIESDTPVGSLILCTSAGQLHEMDIEADIDMRHTSMAPSWHLGDVSMFRKDSNTEGGSVVRSMDDPTKVRMCLGHSHAARITQGFLRLITYWRGPADEGELTIEDTDISVSEDACLQMDEGTGRIVISEFKQKYITIVDLAV